MPGPTKRTRQTTGEENETTPTPIPSTPAISRSSMTTRQRSPVATTPPVTPSRPIYTRSAATTTTTTQPTTPSHLTRSNSLFITPTPTTRRGLGGATSGSIGMGAPTAPIVTGRGGTLTRTQSTPSMAMASPDQLKAVAGGSGGSGRGKGDPEGGDRNWGKGKENIPPKKEDAPDAGSEGSRKRIRVGSRSSGSGRGRSDSISSMRSDSGEFFPSHNPGGIVLLRRTRPSISMPYILILIILLPDVAHDIPNTIPSYHPIIRLHNLV